MSPIAFAMDGLLAILLLTALAVGLKLEKRLRGLRDSQAQFAKAAMELNAAIARAETGLGEIRAVMTEADRTLTERVDEARSAARKLEQAMSRAAAIPAPAPAPIPLAAAPASAAPARRAGAAEGDMAGLPIRDLLARLRHALPDERGGGAEVLDLRDHATASAPAATPRSRVRIDDDLFDAPEAFPSLRHAGAAR